MEYLGTVGSMNLYHSSGRIQKVELSFYPTGKTEEYSVEQINIEADCLVESNTHKSYFQFEVEQSPEANLEKSDTPGPSGDVLHIND